MSLKRSLWMLCLSAETSLIFKALAKRYNFAVQHYRTLLDTTLFDRLSPHVGPTFMLEKCWIMFDLDQTFHAIF